MIRAQITAQADCASRHAGSCSLPEGRSRIALLSLVRAASATARTDRTFPGLSFLGLSSDHLSGPASLCQGLLKGKEHTRSADHWIPVIPMDLVLNLAGGDSSVARISCRVVRASVVCVAPIATRVAADAQRGDHRGAVNELPTFEVAEQRFRNFLAEQGQHATVVWLSMSDFLVIRNEIHVRRVDGHGHEARARASFQFARDGEFGVEMRAVCRLGGDLACVVWSPRTRHEAEEALLARQELKLALATPLPTGRCVTSAVGWQLLRLLRPGRHLRSPDTESSTSASPSIKSRAPSVNSMMTSADRFLTTRATVLPFSSSVARRDSLLSSSGDRTWRSVAPFGSRRLTVSSRARARPRTPPGATLDSAG